MAQIAEDYVSPSVRWGILKQDFPQAVVEFSHCIGSLIGIPDNFGGKDEYCVAQILLRPDDELPVTGYKPVSDARTNKGDHPSDGWNVLCTKALGRALKRAGYADTASEMKLVVQYKQRLAEHDAIGSGDNSHVGHDTQGSLAVSVADISETQATGDSVPIVISAESLPEEEELEFDDSWDTVEHCNESHVSLKEKLGKLPDNLVEQAREEHQRLTGRQWPMESVSQFNALWSYVEDLEVEFDNEADF